MSDRHPLFFTLDQGALLALRNGTLMSQVNRERWAHRYHASETEVAEAFDNAARLLREEATKLEPNTVEVEGK